jgi:hypothetical protein
MLARAGGCRVKPGMTAGLIHNLQRNHKGWTYQRGHDSEVDVTQLKIIIIAGPNGAGMDRSDKHGQHKEPGKWRCRQGQI